jgi:hypothetical protein
MGRITVKAKEQVKVEESVEKKSKAKKAAPAKKDAKNAQPDPKKKSVTKRVMIRSKGIRIMTNEELIKLASKKAGYEVESVEQAKDILFGKKIDKTAESNKPREIISKTQLDQILDIVEEVMDELKDKSVVAKEEAAYQEYLAETEDPFLKPLDIGMMGEEVPVEITVPKKKRMTPKQEKKFFKDSYYWNPQNPIVGLFV